MTIRLSVFLLLACVACSFAQLNDANVNIAGTNIQTRFLPPSGYERINVVKNTFANYLRKLPLKPAGEKVKYFDGSTKNKPNVYAGVVQMDISPKDLQQCADAVMRLRGEYLFEQKKYSEISFRFLADKQQHGFKTYAKGDYSYKKFRKYMDYVFAYANTRSLHAELKSVVIEDMKIGDVLIQTGKPYGHAVIVVDIAIQPETGKKCYLLAQSYMPAQETQILLNPMNPNLSPWYELNAKTIRTPEWTFEPSDLRRF